MRRFPASHLSNSVAVLDCIARRGARSGPSQARAQRRQNHLDRGLALYQAKDMPARRGRASPGLPVIAHPDLLYALAQSRPIGRATVLRRLRSIEIHQPRSSAQRSRAGSQEPGSLRGRSGVAAGLQ